MDVSLSELRELVMYREAWRAVIHGVTKSQTRLSDWTELIEDGAMDLGVLIAGSEYTVEILDKSLTIL